MCTEAPPFSFLRKIRCPTTDGGGAARVSLYQTQYPIICTRLWSTLNSTLGAPLGIPNLVETPFYSLVYAHRGASDLPDVFPMF